MDREVVPDPALAAAVDDAVIGDVLAGLPEAQPARTLRSAADFSSLYVRHRHGLAAHARRYLRDSRDVDEVVQETFLRLFLAISEIETEMQAIAFARRTLTNLCIDRYRADRRRPTLITLDAGPFYDVTVSDEDPDPVLQAEDAAIVRDALARLSPLHRAALVKREIEEKALPQIAAELGVAEDSVKHLLFRARRALRRLLIGTSVEPGIDLTGGDGEPRSNPLLRGAGVFVIFLVGALVVGAGIRPMFSGGPKGQPTTAAVGAPSLDLPDRPDPVAPKPVGPAARPKADHHGASPGSESVLPGSSLVVPTQHHQTRDRDHGPDGHAPSGSHAPRGHFRLHGSGLKVTGEPRVSQGGVATDSTGSKVALSSFNAPTDKGFFDLVQTVRTSDTSGTSVTVRPSFVVGRTVHEPQMTGSAASVRTDAAGNVTVDVVARAQPDPDAKTFPLGSLTAHLVLTPDLTEVLSETVTLSTQPPKSTGPVSTSSGPPPAASPGAPTAGGGSTAPTGPSGTPSTGTQTPTDTGTTPSCPATGDAAPAPGTAEPTTASAANCQPADTGPADTAGAAASATRPE